LPSNIFAERDFTITDQRWFADISGDRNPIHMDASAARRTLAGKPVVHGIHSLLWALDRTICELKILEPIASIKASFEKMIYVGDHVRATLLRQTGPNLRIGLLVDDVQVMRLDLLTGDSQSVPVEPLKGPSMQPTEPTVLTYEQCSESHGLIPVASKSLDIGKTLPFAERALGARRLASLASCSFLIGMVCPGLHSIYRSLSLSSMPLTNRNPDSLCFRVTSHDPDIKLLQIAVWGSGWTGTSTAHVRPEPTKQPSYESIASKVVPREFSDARALVIGGSRGIGELISKAIAAGGGRVIITYATGEEDALAVQREITAHGGHCEIMHFDIRHDISKQLAELKFIPNELYYMATPQIFQRSSSAFIPSRFQEFSLFYVTAFHELSLQLKKLAGENLSIFYPSSTSIDDRPVNMTEYTMAKAAGEILCQDMQSFGRVDRLLVRRLPRMPTDQTATFFEAETADPTELILPIVRDVHTQALSP
jgi:acyl dehydratase